MGPLRGIKVIELAGIGPGPMCAMLLADLGATVLRIDRPEPAARGVVRPLRYNLLLRSRQTLPLDLKQPEAVALVLPGRGRGHIDDQLVRVARGGAAGPGRGTNTADGGAPFYDVYRCADGTFLSVGPIEAKFYAELLRLLGIDPAALPAQGSKPDWPRARAILAGHFATRTRAEWSALLEGSDACAAPVLDYDEAPEHPHLRARGTFVTVEGIVQPAPAPRFSRTRPDPPTPPRPPDARAALQGWLPAEEIARLVR